MTKPMNTGDVARRMGIPVTAALLKDVGFEPVAKDKRAELWNPDEYPAMCEAVAKFVSRRASVPMQPKPPAKPKKGEESKPPAPTADEDEEL